MKICPKCGKENTNNSKYCEVCGRILDSSDNPHSNNKTVWIMIIIAVILAALLITGIMFLLNNNGEGGGSEEPIKTVIPPGPSEDTTESPVDLPEPPDDTPEPPVDPPEPPDGTPRLLPDPLPDEYYIYNGHTYALYNAAQQDLDSYGEVVDFSRRQGGHLAVINDPDENEYLFDLVRRNSAKTVFFGYSDEASEGDWRWSDSYSNYENWTDYGDWYLPDNGNSYGGNEDYAEFNYERGKDGIPNDGTWNDAPFRANTDTFICEWEFDLDNALQR